MSTLKQTYLGKQIMKTVQSIVIAASIILASASAVAGTMPYSGGNDRVESNTIVVSAASTKQAAYQAGLAKLAQLQTASPKQLSQALKVHSSNIDGTTLHLKADGYVTVQERMDAKGSISFVSFVNVGFHYLERITDGNK